MRTLILIALLFILPMQVEAGSGYLQSGNKLVDYMKEFDKAEAKDTETSYFYDGQYLGYVSAAYDAFESTGGICSKSGVTLGQVALIVAKYLKANPEKWNSPAIDLVKSALKSAFPCPS